VQVFNNFQTLLTHSTIPSVLSKVLHPQFVIEVIDIFARNLQKVIKHLLQALQKLRLQTVVISAVKTLVENVCVNSRRHIDSKLSNEAHACDPVLNYDFRDRSDFVRCYQSCHFLPANTELKCESSHSLLMLLCKVL